MIKPAEFTKFDCTLEELQERILFGIAVAGKRSSQIAAALDRFLEGMLPSETPFRYIRRLEERGWLLPVLVEARLAPFTQRERSFRSVSYLEDLSTVPVSVLETIPGIGPKTARMFVVHTREHTRHAVLDTHILAWLREQGYAAPPQTPQSAKQYARLEQAFLDEADKRGLSPAEFDMAIWKARSKS